MNMLVMPWYRAILIKHSLGVAHTEIGLSYIVCVFLTISFVCIGLAALVAMAEKEGCDKDAAEGIIGVFVIACIFACGWAFTDHNWHRVNTNIGAADNVGCYHEMRQLQHIYPKLPNTKSSTKDRRGYYSNSIKSDTSLKHEMPVDSNGEVLTKHSAIRRYHELKFAYRNVGQHRIHASGIQSKANMTRSLKPQTPSFWNRL